MTSLASTPAQPAQPASPGQPARPGPAEALADLLAGNRRFAAGRPRHGHDVAAAAATSAGQQPRAVIIGCIDSRVPLEAIFDQTFGSVCVARSGAHVLDRALIGSIEFAVSALAVPLLMVLGHERCGAIAATIDSLRTGERPAGGLGYLVDEIAPSVRAASAAAEGLRVEAIAAEAMRRHVAATAHRLAGNDVVAAAVAAGDLAVVGAAYDLDTGHVTPLP